MATATALERISGMRSIRAGLADALNLGSDRLLRRSDLPWPIADRALMRTSLQVRFGSKCDLTDPKRDFRSTPDNGLKSDITLGPFRANAGPSPVLQIRSVHLLSTHPGLAKLDVHDLVGIDLIRIAFQDCQVSFLARLKRAQSILHPDLSRGINSHGFDRVGERYRLRRAHHRSIDAAIASDRRLDKL